MAGALIREWFVRQQDQQGKELVSVVISSCSAAKTEARRVEMTRAGLPVIDLVLTTRELARMIKLSGLDMEQLEPQLPDAPFCSQGSAGKLCDVAGGEAEATVRTLYHQFTGEDLSPSKLHRFRIHKSFREMTVKAGESEIRMATVSGLSTAVNMLGELRKGRKTMDILEVMACPDGCINGGGQPIPAGELLVRARAKAIYDLDNMSKLHTAHACKFVQEIYRDLLEEPGSDKSRELFYTTFSEREVLK
jgi:iron only hydrogenase large subunit-like protein